MNRCLVDIFPTQQPRVASRHEDSKPRHTTPTYALADLDQRGFLTTRQPIAQKLAPLPMDVHTTSTDSQLWVYNLSNFKDLKPSCRRSMACHRRSQLEDFLNPSAKQNHWMFIQIHVPGAKWNHSHFRHFRLRLSHSHSCCSLTCRSIRSAKTSLSSQSSLQRRERCHVSRRWEAKRKMKKGPELAVGEQIIWYMAFVDCRFVFKCQSRINHV